MDISLGRTKLMVTGVQDPVECTLKIWSKSDASVIGFKMAGVVFAMAIFSVFIPIVHYITVPGGILLSPLVGRVAYKLHVGSKDIVHAEFNCPGCEVAIVLNNQNLTDDTSIQCRECRETLYLKLATEV